MNDRTATTTDPVCIQPFRVVPAGLVLTALAVGAGLLATAVLLSGGWQGMLPALWGTAAWCLAAAWVALWPVATRSAKAPEGAAQGFVIGMLIRMSLCLVGVLVLAMAPRLSLLSVGLWMTGWYLMLLIGEVMLIKQYLHKRCGSTPCNEPLENSQ